MQQTPSWEFIRLHNLSTFNKFFKLYWKQNFSKIRMERKTSDFKSNLNQVRLLRCTRKVLLYVADKFTLHSDCEWHYPADGLKTAKKVLQTCDFQFNTGKAVIEIIIYKLKKFVGNFVVVLVMRWVHTLLPINKVLSFKWKLWR